MSSSSDILRFRFQNHGDSILSKFNALREEHCFCDITLLLGGPHGITVKPVHFHTHRVVLAASSDFLRDQFLLHEDRSELRVGVISSVEIGKGLLLSCYTGLLETPYLCRRCDRVFQHLESYVGHLKEHRQYLCLVCGKGFSQKSNLARHIHVHTGVTPFRCPLCHKTFSQKAMLQEHFNLLTGDKLHKCNYCAVHFAHNPGLRRHLKDIHGKSSLQNMLEEAVD